MSYWRLESKPASALRQEIIMKLFKSEFLQVSHEQNGVEMIFIDEFKFSSKHCRFKGWTFKQWKGFEKSYSDSFHANFELA